jgi:DNA modification methylase
MGMNMIHESRKPESQVSDLSKKLTAKGRRRREGLAHLARTSSSSAVRRNDIMPKLDLVTLPIGILRSTPNKTRKLDPAHVREIATAIATFGFSAPVLIGNGSTIIDGEARVEAARQLGLDRVPCIQVGHLTEMDQRTLRLAINRLGEKGEWDLDVLQIEFKEMLDFDAPIEVTGFTLDEIDQILLGEEAQGVETEPLAPEANTAAVARPGDVFVLGPHRIICGDATNPDVLAELMGREARGTARLVLTDEPYNVPIAGHVSGGGHREFAMASGEMTNPEFLAFNEAWMAAVLPYLREGGVFGTFIDWRGNPIVHAAATRLSLTPLNLIVWAKTNGGMGSLYRSQHELLPLFKKGSVPHVNNIALGKRGRWRSNLWTYPGASSLGSDARRGLQDHPTVKPTAMLEDALLDLTNRGELVVDPFLGSGSTLIAAHMTGRVCRGVELDPLYADVIVRRFEAMTGETSLLAGTGERFVDLEARRTQETTKLRPDSHDRS